MANFNLNKVILGGRLTADPELKQTQSGIAVVAQAIPTGTTATLPIIFTSEGGNPTPVVGLDDVPITVADIVGTGLYHFFYDQSAERLQLIAPYSV